MSEERAEYVVNGGSAKMPFECEVCGGKYGTLQQARDCEQACKEHCRQRRITREVLRCVYGEGHALRVE